MDAERLAVLGALVQQQNEHTLRLQCVMDEIRQSILLSVRPHHDYQELVHVSQSIKLLYQILAVLNDIAEILLCCNDSFSTTSRSGMTLKQHHRNL